MKLNKPSISLPKLTKGRIIALSLTLLLVLAVIFSAAAYQKHQVEKAAEQAVARQEAKKKAEAEEARVAGIQTRNDLLTTDNAKLTNDKALLCSYTRTLAAARATRVNAHCPN